MLGYKVIHMETQPHPIKIKYIGGGIFEIIEKNGQILNTGSIHNLFVDERKSASISQPRQDIGDIAVQLSLPFPTKPVSTHPAIFYVDWWGTVYPRLPTKNCMDNEEARRWWSPNGQYFETQPTYENEGK